MSRARHAAMHGKKRAAGGLAAHDYTPKDVPAMEEAEDKKDSFKKGGRTKAHEMKMKRKEGGKVHGKKPEHRADRPMRRAAGGRTPLSSAAKVEGRPGGKYDGKPNDARDD